MPFKSKGFFPATRHRQAGGAANLRRAATSGHSPARRPWAVFLFVGLFLAGCGDTINGKSVAEPEVSRFHERLSAHQFAEIYQATGSEFQQAAPKEKVLALFGAIDRKLGRIKSTKEINWSVNTFNLTTKVVLVYHTEFEQGEATETFTFHVTNGKPELMGYTIASLDMLIK